jgi:hypothetical protein
MKTFSVYELMHGQPSRFYNASTNSFTNDVKKATLYTEKEAESKKKELEKVRTTQYQKTGKGYVELHIGDLFKQGILKENKTMKLTKTQLKEIIKEEVQSLNEDREYVTQKRTQWLPGPMQISYTDLEDWNKIQILFNFSSGGRTLQIDVPRTTKEKDIQDAFYKAALAWEKVIQKELGTIKPIR